MNDALPPFQEAVKRGKTWDYSLLSCDSQSNLWHPGINSSSIPPVTGKNSFFWKNIMPSLNSQGAKNLFSPDQFILVEER